MASYPETSPWNKTTFTNSGSLGILRIRPVPASSDDPQYTIETQYTHRPDLLAYDYYGTTKLWWIFAQRNMDIIKDPVYDIEAGVTIYLPKPETLKQILGV
jgi:hypothetical protein